MKRRKFIAGAATLSIVPFVDTKGLDNLVIPKEYQKICNKCGLVGNTQEMLWGGY